MNIGDRLQRALGDAYVIERELGGGGMSRVFLATERSLGRQVVVKVVTGDAATGISIDRFQREIQLAASLQQANIVPLLAAGDADGVPYYTMPFVQGESLRQRLTLGTPIPLSECIGIARDVARALSYAHARGIVHRDIKPDNVLLSHGAAVVTDFGIAKAVSASRAAGDAAALTQTGTAIGTPAYMAPEQIGGDPEVGPKADLYAWGCLVHELLSGAPPFVRATPQGILVAHLTEAPPPLRPLRDDVPAALESLVQRCLAKDPGDRPASADDVLRSLEGMMTASGGTTAMPAAPSRSNRWIMGVGALTLIVVLGIGAVLGRRSGASAGDAAALTGERPSVAVLAFTDRSSGRDQEFLGDGIAETLISALANVPGLDVAARTSAFSFKGKDTDVREIANALGVQAVLEGSVQRSGERLRVTAQLVRAADGVSLWSQTFDRDAADIFAVQDEVARAVVAALDAKLLAGATTGPIGTRDPAAYDLFLQGRGLAARRGTANVTQAVNLLQRALVRDSSFAAAWAALGEAYILQGFYSDVPSGETLQRARAATQRALAIAPRQADALANDAYLRLLIDWDARASDSAFQLAIEVAPGNANAHKWRADVLDILGDPKGGLASTMTAYRLDPLSPIIVGNVAGLYGSTGDRASELTWTNRALTLDPDMPFALRGGSFLAFDRADSTEFFRLSERLERASTRSGVPVTTLRRAWREGGPMRVATVQSAEFARRGLAFERALWALRGNDRAAALRAVEAALAARDGWSVFLGQYLLQYQDDPEFLALLRRAGHPWAARGPRLLR